MKPSVVFALRLSLGVKNYLDSDNMIQGRSSCHQNGWPVAEEMMEKLFAAVEDNGLAATPPVCLICHLFLGWSQAKEVPALNPKPSLIPPPAHKPTISSSTLAVILNPKP
jgi:hypothetical protein